MYHLMVGFQPQHKPLNGRFITARGLHGLLYHVLQQYDADGASWLHGHAAPKPYSLAPYYSEQGHLMGLRFATITEPAAELIINSWQYAHHQVYPLHLGDQTFTIRGVEYIPGQPFADIAQSSADNSVSFRFLSPTAFKQGPGWLPLPLPSNVFASPLRVWKAYAPDVLAMPDDWLDWCHQHVFLTAHQIETVQVNLRQKGDFTGFVGSASFTTKNRKSRYLYAWQALATLATFCGIGAKTTMGMGAVERL